MANSGRIGAAASAVWTSITDSSLSIGARASNAISNGLSMFRENGHQLLEVAENANGAGHLRYYDANAEPLLDIDDRIINGEAG